MKFKLKDKVLCIKPEGTKLKMSPSIYTVSSIMTDGTIRLLEDGDTIRYNYLIFKKVR